MIQDKFLNLYKHDGSIVSQNVNNYYSDDFMMGDEDDDANIEEECQDDWGRKMSIRALNFKMMSRIP